MTEPLTLVFATPPSTNNLYGNSRHGGRFKTRRYKAWIAEAGWQLVTQPRHSFPGDVVLHIRLGPRIPNADATNRIKAAEDLLVSHGIIVDDRHVVSATAEWADDVKGCEVTISERETARRAAA